MLTRPYSTVQSQGHCKCRAKARHTGQAWPRAGLDLDLAAKGQELGLKAKAKAEA